VGGEGQVLKHLKDVVWLGVEAQNPSTQCVCRDQWKWGVRPGTVLWLREEDHRSFLDPGLKGAYEQG